MRRAAVVGSVAFVLACGYLAAARACMGPIWERRGVVLPHVIEWEFKAPYRGSPVCVDLCEYKPAAVASPWPVVVYRQTGRSCVPAPVPVPAALPCKSALGAGSVNGVHVCLH